MSNLYILKAIRLLFHEEISRLAKSANELRSSLTKKVSGDESLSWDEFESSPLTPTPVVDTGPKETSPPDNVLKLKQKNIIEEVREEAEERAAEKQKAKEEEQSSKFYSTEFMLFQRQLRKGKHQLLLIDEVLKGYGRSAEIYIVKNTDEEGKEKMRFASTCGVLVDKKQN